MALTEKQRSLPEPLGQVCRMINLGLKGVVMTLYYSDLGTDPKRSVVSPEFRLHGYKNIYAADSSVFPNAPGINPSLTIMALSLKAAEQFLADVGA